MMRALILAVAVAMPPGVSAADTLNGITILEGEAQVFRGSGRVHAVEGLPVEPGDIVETAAGSFVQVELADRAVAQLGAATRLMLGGPAERAKSERSLYLLGGWIKVTGGSPQSARAGGIDVRTPVLDIPAAPAVLVLHMRPAEVQLFVESGELRLGERGAGAAAAPVALKAGDHYRRKPGSLGVVNGGGMEAFLQEMPRPFRDSLPLRAERFRDHKVQARAAPDFGYADVEPWLKAEPAIRKPLVQRWKSKAREPGFRAALVSNLGAHPEWDRVLFPEKYLPKRSSAPPQGAER